MHIRSDGRMRRLKSAQSITKVAQGAAPGSKLASDGFRHRK